MTRRGNFFCHLASHCHRCTTFRQTAFRRNGPARLLVLASGRVTSFRGRCRARTRHFRVLPPKVCPSHGCDRRPTGDHRVFHGGGKVARRRCLLLRINSSFAHGNISHSVRTLTSLPSSLHRGALLCIIKRSGPQGFRTLTRGHNIHDGIRFFSKHGSISRLVTTTSLLLRPTCRRTTKVILLRTVATKLPMLAATIYNCTRCVISTGYNRTVTRPFHRRALGRVLHGTLARSSLHRT